MKPEVDAAIAEYVQLNLNTPMIWGENDCAMFAATVLDLITGGSMVETLKERRKTHDSLDEYVAVYGTISQHLEQTGGVEIDLNFATMGDFIIVDYSGSESPCVCLGEKTAVVTEEGVKLFPTLKLKPVGVWRVR